MTKKQKMIVWEMLRSKRSRNIVDMLDYDADNENYAEFKSYRGFTVEEATTAFQALLNFVKPTE